MNSGESTTRSVADERAQGSAANATASSAAKTAEQLPIGTLSSTSDLSSTQTIVAPPSRSLVRTQWIVGGVLALLAAVVAGRLWLVEGLTRVARIDGPSMAPAFLGGHYRATCADCGFTFACDAQHTPDDRLAVCPNCGYRSNLLSDDDLVMGERVLIDHWPLVVRQPLVGEVVAASDPQSANELVVKRVAGLPGQRLAIDHGDLVADGRLVRKSLTQLRQVRILVHDNDYQPRRTAGLPERWQSVNPSSGWHASLTGYRLQAGEAKIFDAKKFNWLQYHHWACVASPESRTKLSPVLDNDSYNQAVSRTQNSVPDVQLSCRIQAVGQGRFALAAIDGDKRFEVIVDPAARQVVLTADGRAVADDELPLNFSRRAVPVEFGLCDRQVLLTVAGREVFRHPYDRPEPRRDVLHPLAIGAEGNSLEVTHLRVWRDIHYLDPQGTGREWQAEAPLPADLVALLGDNTSVSTDSRQWTTGVSLSQVRGRVYRPFWGSESR